MNIVFAIVLVVSLFAGTLPGKSDTDTQFATIVRPHLFSIAAWEFRTLTGETIPSRFRPESGSGDASKVIEYFDAAEQARALEYRLNMDRTAIPADAADIEADMSALRERLRKLESTVERVLEKQIRETVIEQEIYNPLVGLRMSFPPVDFKLTKPPHLLVVSPRDRIESVRETMLQPELTVQDMEGIEAQVDQLNASSLVTGIGGLGATYPTFVANDMGLRSTINAATEEWLHQYLAFRPLGFLYVLDLTGIAPNYDIARMNETLAGIVSKEIGGLVYEKYYSSQPAPVSHSPVSESGEPPEAAFDFNREMREIRKAVDTMLAEGKIEEAEQFMNEKRDFLAENGYYIRKLNQAYFAFHGAYADSPTSIDPIGSEMRTLRSGSASVKVFLDRVSKMTSRQELTDAANGQAR